VTTPAGLPADTWMPEAANVAGVVPNEHCSVAPVQTMFGTLFPCPMSQKSMPKPVKRSR